MKQIGSFLIMSLIVVGLPFILSCNSCQTGRKVVEAEPYRQVSPTFNADSAYAFVAKQVSFGPRVPGSLEHATCGDYLVDKLKEYGAEVIEQKADITHYDGKKLSLRNIIASYQPEKEKRILLFAHWDTRPFADEEQDAAKQRQPILGADDGGSGIGVLLEIARNLQLKPTEVGVDLIFFDLEDWGQPSFEHDIVPGDWWCLGSQYWSEHPHRADYKATFGILLDMVGGAHATFLKEGYSLQFAPSIVERIWITGVKLGYGNFFQSKTGGYITDDHVPVNRNGRAPSVDIINLRSGSVSGFAPHWHTHADDMRNIDRNTLKAAGQTVMEVIYTESL